MIIELPTDGHIESVYFIGDKQATQIDCHDTSYIMLSCTIRTYPYKGKNEPKIYERSYKIIPFKGIATVYLGDIFEDYFMIPNKLWEIFDFSTLKDGENIIPLYKPLEADIIFKEYDLNTENLLEEKTIHNLRFIRGKYSDIDLFKNTISVQRSTVNSIFNYTLYETSSNSDFYLYKNKKMTSGIKSTPTILTSYLWKDPKLKTGDTFVLRNNVMNQDIIMNHIVKKGLQTYHIIWLDENLSLKIKDFTGRFITKITHSLTQSTTIDNGNSSSRTIEDIRGLNMILNTGFIFKEDILLLQSIIGSAKSWISMDNLKTFISFVSTTKEIEYDSEAQLYDFDMEISLNYEDKEDHYKAHKEIEYDFIFVYKSDSDQNNTINLNNVFNSSKDPETIDWGDTQVNSELKHTYTNSGEYTIKVKVRKLTRVTLTHQNVIKITKLPATLTQIDCMGCMFDEPAVNLLLTLVLAHNPSIGHVCSVHSGVEYGVGFLSYIYIGNQRPSIILSQDSINKSKQLLDLNWLVDYFSYFNSNGIPTSSRYQTPGNAQKLWPEDCETLAITDSIAIFQKEESTVYMTVDLIGNNLDDTMWNYYAILFEDNGKWTVLKVILGEIDMGTFWEKYSLGSHVGRKNYKIGMLKRIDNVQYPNYSIMWMADFYTYVINEQCVFMRHSNEKNLHYEGIPQTEFFNIYAIGSLSYVGIGKALKDISVEPSIETVPPGTGLTENVKNKCCWEATEAGDYKFTFVNFNLDFSELESKMSAIPTFYLGFFDANGKLQLKFQVAANWDGTVTVNKEVILSLPTGAKIVPFFNGSWKLPLTYINGYVRLKENSCLIIEKV